MHGEVHVKISQIRGYYPRCNEVAFGSRVGNKWNDKYYQRIELGNRPSVSPYTKQAAGYCSPTVNLRPPLYKAKYPAFLKKMCRKHRADDRVRFGFCTASNANITGSMGQ